MQGFLGMLLTVATVGMLHALWGNRTGKFDHPDVKVRGVGAGE